MAKRRTAIPLPLTGGLATKLSSVEAAGTYLSEASNVDMFEKYRALGRIPGTTKVSPAHPSGVLGLHQFEFTDPAGQRFRHQLSHAGNTLYRIESTSKLVTLRTGLAAERLRAVASQDKLFLTGPAQHDLPTGGIRYDGSTVRNWGVLAPGQEEVVYDSINGTSGWTAEAGATIYNAPALARDQDANGGLGFDKTPGTVEAGAVRAGVSLDMSTAPFGLVYLWFYLPLGALPKLGGGGRPALSVTLGDSGLANADVHFFFPGELAPGWNLLAIDTTSPDQTLGAGATLTAVQSYRVAVFTNDAMAEVKGMAWDRLFRFQSGAPTAAAGAAGAITGTVTYRVTFVTETGVESNAGPPSTAITVAGKKVDLTQIPVSADEQVVARRIYRDQDNDATYRFVAQIDDNTTTSYTDNVSSSALGSATAPLAGDPAIDNSPPGRMRAVARYLNRVVGIDADTGLTVRFSRPGRPEAFKIVEQLTVDRELVALAPHANGLLLFATDHTYLLVGDGVTSPFRIQDVPASNGADGPFTTLTLKGLVFNVREDDLLLTANVLDPWVVSLAVSDRLAAFDTPRDIEIGHHRERLAVVLLGKINGTRKRALVYQYGTALESMIGPEGGAGVDPRDLRLGRWLTWDFPVELTCLEEVERGDDLPQLWAGGSDGYVYRIAAPGAVTWAGGSAISSAITFHAMPLGLRPFGEGIARSLELAVSTTTGATLDVTVDILNHPDSDPVATAAFTVAIPAPGGTRILPIPGGARGAWARVKISHSAARETYVLTSALLHAIQRTEERGDD